MLSLPAPHFSWRFSITGGTHIRKMWLKYGDRALLTAVVIIVFLVLYLAAAYVRMVN
jgi:uncharacterized membrane protein YozB (DUF420 family)